MSTKGLRFSKDLNRDKLDDIYAINLDIIEKAITVAELARSQNERVQALRAGQMPLTTRGAQQNATPAATEAA